jgi:hypothetical protein
MKNRRKEMKGRGNRGLKKKKSGNEKGKMNLEKKKYIS